QDTFRSDIDPARSWISHLAIGPLGFIQVVALIALGLSLSLFGVGAGGMLHVTRRPWPWVAILGTGIALVFAGIFVSVPPGWSPYAGAVHEATLHGTVHTVAGTVTFIGLAVSCFLTA